MNFISLDNNNSACRSAFFATPYCDKGLHGVSLETQDDNLAACRLYLKYGFQLGGIDRRVYDTSELYRRETALYFYLLPEWEG